MRLVTALRALLPPSPSSGSAARGGASPEQVLVALSESVRALGFTSAPVAAGSRSKLTDVAEIRDLLTRELAEEQEATVTSDGLAYEGCLRMEDGHLRFWTPTGLSPVSGQVWVRFGPDEAEVSFFTHIAGDAAEGILLDAPVILDRASNRGAERVETPEGPEALGLRFAVGIKPVVHRVLDLSRTGASVLMVDVMRPPPAGAKMDGELVFQGRPFLRVKVVIQNSARADGGVRVGLSFREAEDADCSIGDVLCALAA